MLELRPSQAAVLLSSSRKAYAKWQIRMPCFVSSMMMALTLRKEERLANLEEKLDLLLTGRFATLFAVCCKHFLTQ